MEQGEVLVKITKSLTRNLGNYNSARIEFGMEKVVSQELEKETIRELSVKIDAFLEDEFNDLMED